MNRTESLKSCYRYKVAALFLSVVASVYSVFVNAHDDASSLGPIVTAPKATTSISSPAEIDWLPNDLYVSNVDGLFDEETPADASSPVGSGSLEPFIVPFSPFYQRVRLTPPSEVIRKDKVKSREQLPRISIIIDDLGYNRRGMESSLNLPVEVALAILPHTPFGKKTALKSIEQNRVTLLHAPMENQRELKLGPGGLYASMGEEEFKSVLRDDLASLPGIKGVNNHMGSLLTTDSQAMNWVMQVIGDRSLFFVDSVTSADSVAYTMALRHSINTTKRDVFLDNIRSEKKIEQQFLKLIQLAHQNGHAIAIGHPYPETMAYLSKRLADLSKLSVRLVPIDELMGQ
ncbi:divergent polysaccharide deacetylase family protein [Marinomonas mediterranea]|uniref:divergent polysaccharide deacetylase family protein n=1 Tax=Marinomonas mediterranea TaxID=119864 RepID=UPI00234B234E|nr:divergent polysaccharide deacetylase family protein [Marinomonas mediterranea]WCN10679.1 divergent polysaccharide deacetylase family protein [Marinomonas mediterranea]